MFYSADSNQPGTFSFRLFGFPISIHWSFLILPIVFGAGAVSDPIQQTRFILITVIVFFISILGHELGHAFAYRSFGGHARIMIQAMGGMAISHGSFNRKQKIIITAAGPAFGFMMGLVCLVILLFIPKELRYVVHFLSLMVWINFFWSIFNLLPIVPLDGGQLLGHIMHEKKPVLRGKIGAVTGLVAALVLFLKYNSIIGAAIFGFLSYQNFKAAERARKGYW